MWGDSVHSPMQKAMLGVAMGVPEFLEMGVNLSKGCSGLQQIAMSSMGLVLTHGVPCAVGTPGRRGDLVHRVCQGHGSSRMPSCGSLEPLS